MTEDVMTLWCYDDIMAEAKRATIYFDPTLHRALRMQAAANDTSISEIVNRVVRESLDEDAYDHAIFEERKNDPTRPYEEFARDMKRRGKL
jgi:hypothetical protein